LNRTISRSCTKHSESLNLVRLTVYAYVAESGKRKDGNLKFSLVDRSLFLENKTDRRNKMLMSCINSYTVSISLHLPHPRPENRPGCIYNWHRPHIFFRGHVKIEPGYTRQVSGFNAILSYKRPIIFRARSFKLLMLVCRAVSQVFPFLYAVALPQSSSDIYLSKIRDQTARPLFRKIRLNALAFLDHDTIRLGFRRPSPGQISIKTNPLYDKGFPQLEIALFP
jgi:hypothetical protein